MDRIISADEVRISFDKVKNTPILTITLRNDEEESRLSHGDYYGEDGRVYNERDREPPPDPYDW